MYLTEGESRVMMAAMVIGLIVVILLSIAVPLFVLYALIHTITGWTLW